MKIRFIFIAPYSNARNNTNNIKLLGFLKLQKPERKKLHIIQGNISQIYCGMLGKMSVAIDLAKTKIQTLNLFACDYNQARIPCTFLLLFDSPLKEFPESFSIINQQKNLVKKITLFKYQTLVFKV